jgi:hypothetical protein
VTCPRSMFQVECEFSAKATRGRPTKGGCGASILPQTRFTTF